VLRPTWFSLNGRGQSAAPYPAPSTLEAFISVCIACWMEGPPDTDMRSTYVDSSFCCLALAFSLSLLPCSPQYLQDDLQNSCCESQTDEHETMVAE
jgi:hypothetical protein